MTELNAYEVNVTHVSIGRQNLDLSEEIYLCYCKFYICRDIAQLDEL